MSQSLTRIYVHLVYSTKHRQAFLTDASIREQMHAYLAGTCNNLDCAALIVAAPKTMCISSAGCPRILPCRRCLANSSGSRPSGQRSNRRSSGISIGNSDMARSQ